MILHLGTNFDKSFTPGSEAAKKSGCTCDAGMNENGRGFFIWRQHGFMIEETCPLHKHLLEQADKTS